MIEFPPVTAGEPLTISATTYVTFTKCPEQAAARLRGEYGPESRAAFKGNLAHRIFARHLNEGPIADEDLTQVCREEIGSGLNPKLGALNMKPSELGQVIAEVGALYQRFKQMDVAGFEAAEVYLDLEPSEGVTLRGSVDAVFGDGDTGVRLIDWKTGNVGEADVQLDFYSLLWALDRGDIPGRVEAVSVKTGERAESVPTRSTVQDVAINVGKAVDTIRAGFAAQTSLQRTAGPWCKYCPVLNTCDEGRSANAVASA